MKLKFIAVMLLLAVILPISALGAPAAKATDITNATLKGNVLEISGEIAGGLKGVNVGLVVYDSADNIIHIDQAKTEGLAGTRDAVGFSFTKTNMTKPQSGYKAVVSAKGYASSEKEIEYTSVREFYVSANGAEGADGTFQNPFGTFEEARDAVSDYKEANGGLLPSDVVVYLRGGDYVRTSAFTLTAADSGNNGHTVTYRAYPGETPKIIATSGVLTGWTEENGVWKAQGTTPQMITINDGNTAVGLVAREPNSGYAKSDKVDGVLSTITFKEKYADDIKDFTVESGDHNFFVAIWPNGENGTAIWSQFVAPVKVTDTVDGITSFSILNNGIGYYINTNSRYYLMGAKEFLDAEGEFHVDRTNNVVNFIPPANCTMTADTVLYGAGSFDPISIVGTADDPASDIHISGIEIIGSTRLYAGVNLQHCEDISVSKMYIHDISGDGIKTSGINNRVEIYDNRIDSVGANGVNLSSKLANTEAPEIKGSYSKNNKIYNNYISNVGKLVGSSSAVAVYNCEGTLISNNLIHGSGRFGILLNSNLHLEHVIGKTIAGEVVTKENAHEFVPTRANIIEYNDVYDCMSDSEDGGLIYMVAHDNIIRYNHMHDSVTNVSGGLIGLYLDNGSQHNEAYGNRVYNLTDGGTGNSTYGFNIRGNYNTFTNNIVANMKLNGGYAFQVHGYDDNTVRNNIVYNCGNRIFYIDAKSRLAECDNNIYYDKDLSQNGLQFFVEDKTSAKGFEIWKQSYGFDKNSVFADPGFMDEANADFRMSDSTGFQDIYTQNIGLTPDYSYAEDGAYKKLFVSVDGEESNPGTVVAGEDKQIKLKVFARNTGNFGINNVSASFVSHNEDIVTVSTDGTLNIKGRGKAKVTVSAGNIHTDIYIDVSGAGIWFEDANGNYITSLNVDLGSIKAVADPGDADTEDSELIIAVYSGNTLKTSTVATTKADGIYTIDMNLSGVDTYDTVKAFFWKKGSLYPIFKNKTITKD